MSFLTTIEIFTSKITYLQKKEKISRFFYSPKLLQPKFELKLFLLDIQTKPKAFEKCSIVVCFFNGRLRKYEIFRCVKIYFMFFLVPIMARHVFITIFL